MTQREYDEKHNRLSRLIQDANRQGWKDVQIRAVRALQKLCAENPNQYHEHYAAVREGRAWAYPEKIEIEITGESCVSVETETQEADQWQP